MKVTGKPIVGLIDCGASLPFAFSSAGRWLSKVSELDKIEDAGDCVVFRAGKGNQLVIEVAHDPAAASLERCQRLAVLLRDAQVRAGPGFSGLGVLVTDAMTGLPLFPIGPELKIPSTRRVADVLGSISKVQHPCHDGFHVLDSNLELLATSQYFSPPVQAGADVDRSIKFGGRYLAALFGSCLPDVLAAGIATQDLGVLIFAAGKHVEL